MSWKLCTFRVDWQGSEWTKPCRIMRCGGHIHTKLGYFGCAGWYCYEIVCLIEWDWVCNSLQRKDGSFLQRPIFFLPNPAGFFSMNKREGFVRSVLPVDLVSWHLWKPFNLKGFPAKLHGITSVCLMSTLDQIYTEVFSCGCWYLFIDCHEVFDQTNLNRPVLTHGTLYWIHAE